MAKKTVPDLKELFKQAAEIAKQVPENMQEAAFHRAVGLLTGEGDGRKPQSPSRRKEKSRTPRVADSDDQSSFDDLLQQIDSTQYPRVRSAGKVLDRSLIVLQIALRDHRVDGLTPTEIAHILTKKFRLTTSRQAVGMAFKDASNLVDRLSEGGGYRYRIMAPGEEYLAHLDNDTGAEPGHSVRSTRKRQRTKRPKKSTNANEPSESVSANASGDARPSKKKRARRPTSSKKIGPKAAIMSLIESGFFSAGKTGPEVQGHLKKKRGLDFGTQQLLMAMLRLVRDEFLERDENDDGQYEYKRP